MKAEIGQLVGIPNPNHFLYLFKKPRGADSVGISETAHLNVTAHLLKNSRCAVFPLLFPGKCATLPAGKKVPVHA